jgi:hypothetical protein
VEKSGLAGRASSGVVPRGLLAMQKVVGSNPIIRSQEPRWKRRVFAFRVAEEQLVATRVVIPASMRLEGRLVGGRGVPALLGIVKLGA